MATHECESVFRSLELPDEYQDLEGLIRTDLTAIVGALTQRAQDRLLLTRRETLQLRQTLWNNLTAAVAEAKRHEDAGAYASGEAAADKFFARSSNSRHSYELDQYRRTPSRAPESRGPRGGPGVSGWL